ncbi:MAG: hypothetical protein H6681_05090 [Desulfobacteraceae bacterium]|nr:hypothetical protein [Desulfobacteraceae bacterium]MCB9494799.1 hypothetical protein [Desulfobacteraceae bacterium]
MNYQTRLFCQTQKLLTSDILRSGLGSEALAQNLLFETEKTDTHNQIIVKKNKLELIIIIELLPEKKEEDNIKLKSIIEYSEKKLPQKNMKWVKKYISKTKVFYEFIPLSQFESEEDWEILSIIQTEAWVNSRGIFQYIDEGFTNESGDLVLWDYPFSITGKRIAAVKDFTGRWKTFEMDLESINQRKSFFEGKVPKNSKLIFRG